MFMNVLLNYKRMEQLESNVAFMIINYLTHIKIKIKL